MGRTARAGFSSVMRLFARWWALRSLRSLSTVWRRRWNGAQKKRCYGRTLQEQKIRQRARHDECFNARILLVEDNHVNQMVAAAMLKKMGCVIDLAGDGLEGIRQAVFRDYDLIFMDCQMPELDGYEATRELRAREQSEKTIHRTIIAMTAHAMRGDREICLAAGMDDYMTKPLSEDTLFSMLEKWLPEEKKRSSKAA